MPDRTDVEIKLGVLQAWVIGTVCFMLALCITGVLAVAYVVTNQRNAANNVLACYIENSADRSRKALPAVTYYAEHPDQMQLALRQIQETLDDARDAFGSCHNN